MHHRHFNRTHLQNLGAERRHFQHFFKSDPLHTARFRHDARIGGVDAIDVRIDVAAIRLDGGGERDGAGVGAAPAQRRDAAGFLVQSLKTGDDRDFAALEAFDNAGAVD